MYLNRSAEVSARKVDKEIVLVDNDGMQVHQLNETASYIWDKCDGKHTVADVVASLTHDFHVDLATAKKEVNGLVAQLQDLRLLLPN